MNYFIQNRLSRQQTCTITIIMVQEMDLVLSFTILFYPLNQVTSITWDCLCSVYMLTLAPQYYKFHGLTWTSPGLAAALSACPPTGEDFSAPTDPPLALILIPSHWLPRSGSRYRTHNALLSCRYRSDLYTCILSQSVQIIRNLSIPLSSTRHYPSFLLVHLCPEIAAASQTLPLSLFPFSTAILHLYLF